MSYPVVFAGLTTAQMASLDQMFGITGSLGVIPCNAAGTNLITLTPIAGITPPITAYANYVQFSFVAQVTSTGSVTLQINSLSALPVYTQTGSQAGSGSIAANSLYIVVFNQALNGGSGGWQITSGPSTAVNAALTSGRNRMINGGMDIDQRSEGTAVAMATQTNKFISDQTVCSYSGLAPNVTAQRVAVTGLAAFSHGLQVSINSGSASVGAQDYLLIYQNAEGINVADLGFGTAVAQSVSLGVWVNSSVGGNVGIALRNSGNTRSYVSVTSATAGSWTFCPVANIPGDSVGTWLTGSGQAGINYCVTLTAGSSLMAPSINTWAGTNYVTSAAQTNIQGTAGATFIVTGLSLEPGATANTFDRRPYPEEFAMCQRYYEKSYGQGVSVTTATTAGITEFALQGLSNVVNQVLIQVPFKVTKCTTPTIATYSPATGALGKAHDYVNAADVNAGVNTNGQSQFNSAITQGGSATQVDCAMHWTADAGV